MSLPIDVILSEAKDLADFPCVSQMLRCAQHDSLEDSQGIQERFGKTSRRVSRSIPPRRGHSLIWGALIMTALLGFVSMAVDIGRVRLARSQLQTATDAAARAAADSLPISTQTVITNATDAAGGNGIIDADEDNHARTNPGLKLLPDDDLVFGVWDPEERTFTPIDGDGSLNRDERRSANAVQITGRRIKSRNTEVPLIFAPVFKVFWSDMESASTALITGGPSNFAFVGLNSVSANGATIDSMIYGQDGTGGGIASDGDIALGSSDVYGDARAGRGDRLSGGHVVTGWTANLDYTLSQKFPAITTPPGTQTFNPPQNGDWTIPPTGSRTSNNPLSPRAYRVEGIDLSGGRDIRIRGYVTLYVEGDINAGSDTLIQSTTGDASPSRFTINVVGNHSVTLGGRARQYLHLYAPRSTVTVRTTRSGGGFYGWIVARRLNLQSGARLHYDETRNDEKPYKISLVK